MHEKPLASETQRLEDMTPKQLEQKIEALRVEINDLLDRYNQATDPQAIQALQMLMSQKISERAGCIMRKDELGRKPAGSV